VLAVAHYYICRLSAIFNLCGAAAALYAKRAAETHDADAGAVGLLLVLPGQ
jgi:hypothetical protein